MSSNLGTYPLQWQLQRWSCRREISSFVEEKLVTCLGRHGILIWGWVRFKWRRMMGINLHLQTLVQRYKSWIEHSNIWMVTIRRIGPEHPLKWFRSKNRPKRSHEFHNISYRNCSKWNPQVELNSLFQKVGHVEPIWAYCSFLFFQKKKKHITLE